MGGLEEVTILVLKSNLSPSVRQCTLAFWSLKNFPLNLTASEMSTMVTPCSPYTLPCPFSQKNDVFQSSPTAIGLSKSTRKGAILPMRPHTWKWVSNMMDVHLNPGILPAFSSYCVQLVPFRTSARLVPLTSASEMVLGASPTELAKQSTPYGDPYPYVSSAYTIDPAELPDTIISSLKALSLTTANRGLSDPSSFSHARTCLDWSPPVKNKISALRISCRLACPRAVSREFVSCLLSVWTEMWAGAMPNPWKICSQLGPNSSSQVQVALPYASVSWEDVMTAIRGHLVMAQSSAHWPGIGYLPATAAARSLQKGESKACPPIMKSLRQLAETASRTSRIILQILVIYQYKSRVSLLRQVLPRRQVGVVNHCIHHCVGTASSVPSCLCIPAESDLEYRRVFRIPAGNSSPSTIEECTLVDEPSEQLTALIGRQYVLTVGGILELGSGDGWF